MDLAQFIVDASAQTFKDDCIANQLEIVFLFHDKYKHLLYIIPMAAHVIIKFRTVEYKVQRNDKTTFDELIHFLLDVIGSSVAHRVNFDMEHEGYWPNDHENFGTLQITVSKKNDTVFDLSPRLEGWRQVAFDYLKHMRLIV